MSLEKTAQFFEIEEQADLPLEDSVELEPSEDSNAIIVYEDMPSEEVVMELHDPETGVMNSPEIILEVSPDAEAELDFTLPTIPGAQEDKFVEVVEDKLEVNDEEPEEEKKKPSGPWDWKTGGIENFLTWLKARYAAIPRHDGQSMVGCERAKNYLEKLQKSISEAVREDLDGVLDIGQVETILKEIVDGVSRLEDRIEKIESQYPGKKKKKVAESENGLVKEAGTPFHNGMIVSVPLIISRVARTCINGTVSAGHDIEYLFKKQVEEFDLTKREQAEVIQLLADMGFALRRDRLQMLDEEFDETSSDNGDFAANFPG